MVLGIFVSPLLAKDHGDLAQESGKFLNLLTDGSVGPCYGNRRGLVRRYLKSDLACNQEYDGVTLEKGCHKSVIYSFGTSSEYGTSP